MPKEILTHGSAMPERFHAKTQTNAGMISRKGAMVKRRRRMPSAERHLFHYYRAKPCHCEFICVILSGVEGPIVERSEKLVERPCLRPE